MTSTTSSCTIRPHSGGIGLALRTAVESRTSRQIVPSRSASCRVPSVAFRPDRSTDGYTGSRSSPPPTIVGCENDAPGNRHVAPSPLISNADTDRLTDTGWRIERPASVNDMLRPWSRCAFAHTVHDIVKRLQCVVALRAVAGTAIRCGGSSAAPSSAVSADAPGPLAGSWAGTVQLDAVTGGECLNEEYPAHVPLEIFPFSMTQRGGSVTASNLIALGWSDARVCRHRVVHISDAQRTKLWPAHAAVSRWARGS